jgi:hypothetical protein
MITVTHSIDMLSRCPVNIGSWFAATNSAQPSRLVNLDLTVNEEASYDLRSRRPLCDVVPVSLA